MGRSQAVCSFCGFDSLQQRDHGGGRQQKEAAGRPWALGLGSPGSILTPLLISCVGQ